MRLFKFNKMAIINTLREKMGRLVVVVVGFSILAFVLTDLLGPQSSILGTDKREVGSIDGESISQEEFATIVENLKQYYGFTSSDPASNQFIRQQAWDQLINDIAFTKKLDALGLEIGTEERIDMVQGNNISPSISNFFQQFLGTTEKAQIKEFLSQITLYGPEAQFYFANAEQQAMVQRRREKFLNLLSKTSYVTLAEAQKAYTAQLGFVDVDYLYVPFNALTNDEIGEISEADLRSYYDDHREDYEVEETRSLEYVSFPVIPSAEDSASYRQQMQDIKNTLASGVNDSSYAMSMTEQGLGFTTYDPSALPLALADNLTELKAGDIVGPNLQNGVYSLQKVTDIVDTEDEFARASQIVFYLQNRSATEKGEIRTTANNVLRRLRKGEKFDDLAREYSDGDFSTGGGDLGWIKKGSSQIADIEDVVFGAKRTGLVNRLIEKNDKIYIINVSKTKISKRYKVAQVIIEMVPSYETTNQVYIQAAEFAASVDDVESFRNQAAEEGYSVFSGTRIDKNEVAVGRLENARSLVTWLYSEAQLEDVKDFDLENEYAVAVYSDKTEEGVQPFSEVRSTIEEIVTEQKKAEYIKNKLSTISGSLSAKASAYGESVQVFEDQTLRLEDNNLGSLGIAPEAIGAAFALQNPGDQTSAYEVDGLGIVMLELKSKSEAAQIGDYTTYENQLLSNQINQIQTKLVSALKEKIEVIDERYKYF